MIHYWCKFLLDIPQMVCLLDFLVFVVNQVPSLNSNLNFEIDYKLLKNILPGPLNRKEIFLVILEADIILLNKCL
jgi:hypothetical protein